MWSLLHHVVLQCWVWDVTSLYNRNVWSVASLSAGTLGLGRHRFVETWSGGVHVFAYNGGIGRLEGDCGGHEF